MNRSEYQNIIESSLTNIICNVEYFYNFAVLLMLQKLVMGYFAKVI